MNVDDTLKTTNKNKTNNPNGRPKGSPNKTTIETREALSRLLNSNVDQMQDWIDKIGKEDPYKAATLILRMAELIVPKPRDSEGGIQFNAWGKEERIPIYPPWMISPDAQEVEE